MSLPSMLRIVRQRFRDARTLKALCFGAERLANQRGQREPGAEHFVLAALELPDQTARQAFARLGVEPAAFAEAIERQYLDALATVGVAVDPEFDRVGEGVPTARGPYRAQASGQGLMRVLTREVMVSEQRADPRAALRGAHVLLAAGAARRGVCARSFEALGLTPEAVSVAARQVLSQAPAA